jgi:hypothetical protein
MILKFTEKDLGSVVQKLFHYCNGHTGKFILEIKKSKNVRSLSQNRFYWGVVLPIMSDFFGYSNEEMHQICATTYLRYEKDGKEFTKSTTKLDTKEFETYIEKIRQWAMSEYGVHIPTPNEVTEEMYIELQRKYNSV